MVASRKEYELLFALNAQLNGGFSGTFSKAQSEFSRLGKEIQELHRLQNDIASYQKQQSALDSTRQKLENLRGQHDLLQKEIAETTGSTAGLEREKLKLEQRIQNTEAALERQGQKLEATGARLQEAGIGTSNLAGKEAELAARIRELAAEQDKAAESAEGFGDSASSAFEAAGQAVVAAGITAALKEITDAYMECVALAGDFEASLSDVEALSGANVQEMEALSDKARELGATTKFTALEASKAMGYMAMAGWDASEMISGMDGVLQLAAASGEDLSMVSDIVTDSLSAFGLTAADTAHFSDVLAAAATSANTNVSTMGETFKMSASVAGALGYSIEDVATAVGLMANSGVKGSIAGTALKNTFNGLLEGVTLTGAAFGEYEYSATRADGTMKSFGSTVNELRGYFERMTEAERVQNATAIAGKEGYNGLLAVLNATNEDYASLAANINNCTGAAQRMAAVKLDNLNGQLTLMDSAWDALRTTIGEQFNPELRSLAETGTDVLGWIDGFIQENPALVKGVMTFTGVMGAAAVSITGVNAAMKVFQALNVASMFTNPVFLAAGAVAALAGGVVALATAADDGLPSVKELTAAARGMGEAMEEAGASFEANTTEALAAAEVAQLYIARLEEIEQATDGNVAGNQEYHNILALLTRTIPELADDIDLTTDSIEGGTEALRAHTEAWKKDAEAQARQEYLNALYDQYNAVQLEAQENSIQLTQAQMKLEAAEKNREAALERMNELSREAAENGGLLSGEYYELERAVLGYNDEAFTASELIGKFTKAMEVSSEAVAASEAEIDSVTEAMERLNEATDAQAAAGAETARQTQELQAAIEDTAAQVAALSEAYTEAYAAAYDSISGQYALWDEAAKVAETSAGSINSALESQITYWQDYNANLQMLTERSAEIEGLSDVIASFADGSADSVNAVAGLASASDEELSAMVENWRELQKQQEEAAGSVADLKTDFTATMDELQTALAKDIEAMDLRTEAAESGKATIQGYIDGAGSMLPQVQAAYSQLAQAAGAALSNTAYGGRGMPLYNGDTPHYATGTENAAPGLALVGENGPELVFFRGGERVLNASETARRAEAVSAEPAAAPGGFSPSIQVIFQISGSATSETVDALQSYGDEFAARVLEVMENAGMDAARRAYA